MDEHQVLWAPKQERIEAAKPKRYQRGVMELFVVLRPGLHLTDELTGQIRKPIRQHCSPPHVPDRVSRITEAPRTLSGKLLEVPVKRILMGTPAEQAASRESLANPGALDPFIAIAAQQRA